MCRPRLALFAEPGQRIQRGEHQHIHNKHDNNDDNNGPFVDATISGIKFHGKNSSMPVESAAKTCCSSTGTAPEACFTHHFPLAARYGSVRLLQRTKTPEYIGLMPHANPHVLQAHKARLVYQTAAKRRHSSQPHLVGGAGWRQLDVTPLSLCIVLLCRRRGMCCALLTAPAATAPAATWFHPNHNPSAGSRSKLSKHKGRHTHLHTTQTQP